MTTNITDSDAFTEPVVVPDDTEAANQASLLLFAQALANRTRYLFNRLCGARYTVSGSGVAQAANYTLTLAERSDTGFSLGSNLVTVPRAGWYLVAVTLAMSNTDTNNPDPITLSLKAGATEIAAGFGNRFTASASEAVGVSALAVVHITTPSSQKIGLVEATGVGTGAIAARTNALSIVQFA